ncbi:MAG: hypothetical protein Q8P79_02445 [Nanoarchaeota archaeon]|nr:hypothetical protein [Nanoarchaeota archaeon]
MILYFDNYITDEPFHPGGHEGLDMIRNSSCDLYSMPSKLDITLYTLASYAEIKWSTVIIKYELQNISQKYKFEKFVRKLFPHVMIIYGRSNSQEKFQDSIRILKSLKDEWVFYAGNNDHPFTASNKKTINACLKKAKKFKRKSKFISIAVTHFSEFLNKPKEGTPYHEISYPDSRIIEEDENCIVSLFPKGLYHSMQIIHIDLFTHWFFSGDSKGKLVRRSEDMTPFIKTKNQIVIIPKNELCAHFDGEVHTNKGPYNLGHDIVPPLFIPQGFFDNKIKISFGYDKYREGWVNINPLKEKYSFRDNINGTDLKIGLEDIPLFWKKKIKKIDINPNLDKEKIKYALKKRKYNLENPFPKKGGLYYSYYRTKDRFFRHIYKIKFMRDIILSLMKKYPYFKKAYVKSVKISFDKNNKNLYK